MTKLQAWNDAEVRQVLSLFLRTDPSAVSASLPALHALSTHLMRSPDVVLDKMMALAECSGGRPLSLTDQRVWREFLVDPGSVLRAFEKAAPYQFAAPPTTFAHRDPPMVRGKIADIFFREMILASYGSRCALTGLDDDRLLVASHIVVSPHDGTNRLNPTNGICLNALHDRAFNRHMITFDANWRMVIRADVSPEAQVQLIRATHDKLRMPSRFAPDPEFMREHRRQFHAELARQRIRPGLSCEATQAMGGPLAAPWVCR